MSTASSENPFWRFSLGLYRAPGVADACIALQDEAGADVNVLLFLLWNATSKRQMSAASVRDLDARIGPWRKAAVIPLREIRRALKAPPAIVDAGAAEAFRTRVKAAELEAERLQQQTLYDLAPSLPFETARSASEAARASVEAYAAIGSKAFPPAAVATILAAFDQFSRDA